jgi:hypothetical protein
MTKSHKRATPQDAPPIRPLIVRDFEVPAIVGAKATQINVWEALGEMVESMDLTDTGRAKGKPVDELDQYVNYRRAKRDGTIADDVTWIGYREDWLLRTTGKPIDDKKVVAHKEFIRLYKAGKIPKGETWRDFWNKKQAA